MNNHIDCCSSEEAINLYDIWKKLVQYKKVFWCIFAIVFIIGGVKVLLTPYKYVFSQVIELGRSSDERGQNTVAMNADKARMLMIKIFYPQALRTYNIRATKKIYWNKKIFIVEKVESNTFAASHG